MYLIQVIYVPKLQLMIPSLRVDFEKNVTKFQTQEGYSYIKMRNAPFKEISFKEKVEIILIRGFATVKGLLDATVLLEFDAEKNI